MVGRVSARPLNPLPTLSQKGLDAENNDLKGKHMIDLKFDLCVSVDNYTHKPTRKECSKIRFETRNVDMNEMQNLIGQGFAYTSLMRDNWRCGDNFVCSHTLTFDVDHSKISMNQYISNISIKPTLAYTSSSNGTVDGEYSFRLVYLLNNGICTMNEYETLSKTFAKLLQLSFLDNRSWKGDQMWFGCQGCQTFSSDTVVDVEYIQKNVNSFLNIKHEECKTPSTDEQNGHKNYYNTQYHNSVNAQFKKDYETMTFQDFIKKYYTVYQNLEHTPIEVSEDEPIIHYDDDYYEIRRPWQKINGQTLKIKDGERRRMKLFLNGIIRRKINPSITFENMLYNLVFEFENYYINNGNKITKRDIWYIAENVMKAEVIESSLGKPRYKSKVNDLYRLKHNLSRQQVWGMVRNKSQYIGEFYDPSLTDKENLKVMNEYGFDIKSEKTIQRWREKNGIKKYKKIP